MRPILLIIMLFFTVVVYANHAPVYHGGLKNQKAIVDRDFEYIFGADFFTDSDGDTLTYDANFSDSDEECSSVFHFDSDNRKFYGKPSKIIGCSYIYVTATDPDGLSNDETAQFGITIKENSAPVHSGDLVNQIFSPGKSFEYIFANDAFTDPDGDALTYSAKAGNGSTWPNYLHFDADNRRFYGTAPNTHDPQQTIIITATDIDGLTTTGGFTVEVDKTGPVYNGGLEDQTLRRGEKLIYTFADDVFTEPDGDSIDMEMREGEPWLKFSGEVDRRFTTEYDKETSSLGTTTVKVRAWDGQGEAFGTFDMNVVENQAPVFDGKLEDIYHFKGEAFITDPFSDTAFSDPDNDPITLSAKLADGNPLPSWLTFNENERSFSISSSSVISQHTVRVTAIDEYETPTKKGTNEYDNHLSVYSDFIIEIDDNHAPVYEGLYSDQNWMNGQTFSYPMPANTFTDADNDTLSYALTLENGDPSPDWIDFNSTTGELSGTAPESDVVLSLKVTATDSDTPEYARAEGVFEATIVNHTPVYHGLYEDQNWVGGEVFSYPMPTDNFTDEDENTLSYSITMSNNDPPPSWLKINSSTGEITGTPHKSYYTLTLKVTAKDSGNKKASGQFKATIGAPEAVAPKLSTGFGNALEFDGVNDSVKFDNDIVSKVSEKNAITIEYWFKGTQLRSAVHFQQEYDDEEHYVYTGYIIAGWGSTEPTYVISTDGDTGNGISCGDESVIENNQWHHLAMTWERNTTNGFKSYLDGQLVAQRDTSDTALPGLGSNHSSRLGSKYGTSSFLKGTLDEVRIWDKALTEAEIKNWMYRMVDKTHPSFDNLKGYFRLDSTSGTDAKNSASGYAGSLSGGTWVKSDIRMVHSVIEGKSYSSELVGSDGNGTSSDGADWTLTFQTPSKDGITPAVGTFNFTEDNKFTYKVNATNENSVSFNYALKAENGDMSDNSEKVIIKILALLNINTTTNGYDSDNEPGEDTPIGDDVNWSYVVTNYSDVNIHNINVSDDQGVSISCPATSLDVNDSMTCTAHGTATSGQYGNTATVTGLPPTGDALTDTDPSHYFGGTADTTPDAFSFTDQVDVNKSTLSTSNSITVTGINTGIAISVSGGEYEVNESGNWLTSDGRVEENDTVKVHHTSSENFNTTIETILTINETSDTFSTTTKKDSDGDNLADSDEVNIYHTDSHNPDSDYDGVNDGDEVNNGSDPLTPSYVINPVTYLFGTSSGVKVFTITNYKPYAVSVQASILDGVDAHLFNIESDDCAGVILSENESCTIKVSYPESTNKSYSACLNVNNVKACLHNYETTSEEASRRLPPVIDNINISETMNVGIEYNLTFSVVGYDNTYTLYMAFFKCDASVTEGECGSSYANEERFDQALNLTPYLTEQSTWNYNGKVAMKFHYSYLFTPQAVNFESGNTDIVIRFYYKSDKDTRTKKRSISVIIPGNLSDNYYDTSGRKIKKIVHKD